MKQLRHFDQSKGGNKAGYCLQNVRLGYGIAPLYNDAWTAWKNTQQHKTRTIPAGDVPLFYDYTDSKGNRYGHINVRLKDGRVWNDGKTYKSLAIFERYWSNVKYVGWGESINGVKVLVEGEEMLTNKNHLIVLWQRFIDRKPGSGEIKKYLGQSYSNVVHVLDNSSERPAVTNAIKVGKKAIAEKWELKLKETARALAIKDAEITRLKSQVGDSTKWETLKTLLRELIGR